MRIDAITCCVGEVYAVQLARSLPIWLDTLDSLTVVTKPHDSVLTHDGPSNLRFVTTDVFTAFGAHFNKGAALNEAIKAADPTEWTLHVDSDIIPPADWRTVVERTAQVNCLSGAFRYDEGGKRLDERPLYPYGYFHLWHASDKRTWRWPLLENWHSHAGSYDANFTDLWPRHKRKDLGLKLIHQGERRTNWFGPDSDPQMMQAIASEGYRAHRMRANRGEGRLPIPEPANQYRLASLEQTRECRRRFDQFAVETRYSAPAEWPEMDSCHALLTP